MEDILKQKLIHVERIKRYRQIGYLVKTNPKKYRMRWESCSKYIAQEKVREFFYDSQGGSYSWVWVDLPWN